ncbi:MAG TPA: response regulator transcription factor [Candidatus Aveggerthella stercoripullorum]|uniref:Response regulator transcription factor n=1 Tax=Candidatus Aveggerthella stercoripullorum TaxID=2840688 RepID=A0A9D1A0Q7_9ACTN|nr:response regulator transcription factor [Candidatus Aveggerthella stercoripullorum]
MIYYVEDDKNVRELAVYALSHAGIEVEGLADDEEFRAACARRRPDVVVLDIMLPGTDGLEILRRIRQTPGLSRVPVMMVTAKSTELDIVTALDEGADEYLTKPYGMMEMVSRVRALLRRASDWGAEPTDDGAIAVGPLSVCLERREATCGSEPLSLTAREFDLLAYFMQSPGTVFSREDLLRQVWGWSFGGGSRTVDAHVLTLRQKLGDHADMIETVRGVGYRLREE